jgi:hypothetical protein
MAYSTQIDGRHDVPAQQGIGMLPDAIGVAG